MKKSMKSLALMIGLTAATAIGGTAYADGYGQKSQMRDQRAGVILFEHANFNGQRMAIDGAIPNLGAYRFNDKVSSINIRSGNWMVCTDANFQGRCEILKSDMRQIGQLRLNDNISSIRPVATRYQARNDYRDPRSGGIWRNDRQDHRYDHRDGRNDHTRSTSHQNDRQPDRRPSERNTHR